MLKNMKEIKNLKRFTKNLLVERKDLTEKLSKLKDEERRIELQYAFAEKRVIKLNEDYLTENRETIDKIYELKQQLDESIFMEEHEIEFDDYPEEEIDQENLRFAIFKLEQNLNSEKFKYDTKIEKNKSEMNILDEQLDRVRLDYSISLERIKKIDDELVKTQKTVDPKIWAEIIKGIVAVVGIAILVTLQSEGFVNRTRDINPGRLFM